MFIFTKDGITSYLLEKNDPNMEHETTEKEHGHNNSNTVTDQSTEKTVSSTSRLITNSAWSDISVSNFSSKVNSSTSGSSFAFLKANTSDDKKTSFFKNVKPVKPQSTGDNWFQSSDTFKKFDINLTEEVADEVESAPSNSLGDTTNNVSNDSCKNVGTSQNGINTMQHSFSSSKLEEKKRK